MHRIAVFDHSEQIVRSENLIRDAEDLFYCGISVTRTKNKNWHLTIFLYFDSLQLLQPKFSAKDAAQVCISFDNFLCAALVHRIWQALPRPSIRLRSVVRVSIVG